MPQGQRMLTFVDNGGRRSTVPHSPPRDYRSTRPLRRHPPFGLERNHLFAYTLRPPRYYNEFIIGPGATSSPLRGTATRLFYSPPRPDAPGTPPPPSVL